MNYATSTMTTAIKGSKSFVCAHPSPPASLRLFCFPYAGGSSAVFREWGKAMPREVEVLAAELPGRGHRIKESLVHRMAPLVEGLATAILPFLDKKFAFFGHSMGATLAFELSQLLSTEVGLQPAFLFVSGRNAPHVPMRKPLTYDLPDKEFIAELCRLNGTPREVLEHPELLSFVLPVLRADFELIQTYKFSSKAPLTCPIIAFAGSKDPDVLPEDVEPWSEHTHGRFTMTIMPGDHFYLDSLPAQLLQHIRTGLKFIS